MQPYGLSTIEKLFIVSYNGFAGYSFWQYITDDKGNKSSVELKLDNNNFCYCEVMGNGKENPELLERI